MKANRAFLIFCIFLFNGHFLFGQQGEWTWMGGYKGFNSPGHYGTQGVADTANTPPGLYEANTWTDFDGNFWLFGGFNWYGSYSDLWKYNVTSKMWTWLKGPGIPKQPGVYGVKGIPSPGNCPAARSNGFCTWTDDTGDLWLFGGFIMGSGCFNDLWRYNIQTNEWTWMSGTNINNHPGSYGQLGITIPSNIPPSRYETTCAWEADNGDFWLFGGRSSNDSVLNDLWKYNIQSNQWTWMKGSKYLNQPGIYGIQGVPDPLNTPGARMAHARWKDPNGNFLLFGGGDIQNFGYSRKNNDLWLFNPLTNNWTWISGSNQIDALAVTGGNCIASVNNMPSGRLENKACWADNCGNIYNYGGSVLDLGDFNDLWSYNTISREWTFIKGSFNLNQPPVYGVKNISAPGNWPGGRRGPCSWTDQEGNFWLFGGDLTFPLNDLWKYVPSSSCPYNPGTDNLIVSADTTICKGDTIQLIASGGQNYSWSQNGSIDNPDIANPRVFPMTNTTYKVKINNGLCAVTKYVHVNVYPKEDVFIFPVNPSICFGRDIELKASASYDFQWEPSTWLSSNMGSSVIAGPLENITYTINWTDQYTCRNTANVFVTVIPCINIWVPNAFTPTGDYTNEIFLAKPESQLSSFHMRIYSRRGFLVFETYDVSKGWDGKYKGKDCLQDTYNWFVDYESIDGNIKGTKNGFVTLLR